MFPKDKSSLTKVHPPLQPLRELPRGQRALETLLTRFEDKFDRLSNIIEQGLTVIVNSQNDRIDRLTSVVENGFATFNGKAMKKLNRMNASIQALTTVMKSQLDESKVRQLNIQEREQSVVDHEPQPNTTEYLNTQREKIIDSKSGAVDSNLEKQVRLDSQSQSPSNSNEVKLIEPPQFGQFRDKNLVVTFGQPIQKIQLAPVPSFEQLRSYAIKWIGKTVDIIVKQSFKGYYSKEMSEVETRGFVCNNLLLNFLQMLKRFNSQYVDIWMSHSDDFVHLFEGEIAKCLSFYLVKYPQKSKIFVSDEAKNLIKERNQSTLNNYSMLKRLKVQFNPCCGVNRKQVSFVEVPTDFSHKIKQLLNKLITQAQNHLPAFKELMGNVFTLSDAADQARKTVDHLIGMKFKQDMPVYTAEEMRNPGIPIKRPEVLRVLIKWTEELDSMVAQPDQLLQLERLEMIKLSRLESDIRTDYLKELIACIKKNAKSHFEIGTSDRSVLDSAYRNLHQHIEERKGQFEALPSNIVSSGMTVSVISELTSHTAVLYLNGLISFLYQMHIMAYNNLSQKGYLRFLQHDEEIIRFSVMDILRAKCSGTLAELKKIIANLLSNSKIRLVRVKNRLATGNRDFLINFVFAECPLLCEVQIGLKEATADEKSGYQDHFNHFLYEIARSKFGPLSESALIISYQNDIGAYFKKQTKRVKSQSNLIEFKHELSSTGQLNFTDFELISSECVFLCSNCLEVSSTSTKLLGCWKRKTKDQFLCGNCIANKLTKTEELNFILGSHVGSFFKEVTWQEQTEHPSEYIAVVQSEVLGYINVYSTHRPPGHSIVDMVIAERPMFRGILKDYVFKSIYYKCFEPILKLYDSGLFKNKRVFCLKSEMVIADIGLNVKVPRSGTVLKKKLSECEIAQELQEKLPYLKQSDDEYEISYLLSSQISETTHPKEFKSVRCAINPANKSILVLSGPFDLDELVSAQQDALVYAIESVNFDEKGAAWILDDKNFDENTFQDLGEDKFVQAISLCKNKFTRIDFLKAPALEKLIMVQNKIVRPVVHFNYPQLTDLFLSMNLLETLDLQLLEIPTLSTLNVAHNRISKIITIRSATGAQQPTFSNLRALDVSHNALDCWQILPIDFPQIAELRLDGNRNLTQLDLTGFQTLASLNFSYCNLTSIVLEGKYPQFIQIVGNATSLKEVDLSRLNAPYLRSLCLSQGRLQKVLLPKPTVHLSKLDLSNNFLTEVDLYCQQLLKEGVKLQLSYLELNCNSISKLNLVHFGERVPQLDVSINSQMEVYLPEGYKYQALVCRRRSEKDDYRMWQLSLLDDDSLRQFKERIQPKLQIDLSAIFYISTAEYLEAYETSIDAKKSNKEKVDMALLELDKFLDEKKLREKYPNWENLLLKQKPLKMFRLKKGSTDTSSKEQYQLVVDRIELPVGTECFDCKEPLETVQYYTISEKKSICLPCMEKENQHIGLGRYAHLENAVLIRTAKPFVDSKRLGNDIKPKNSKECKKHTFTCAYCRGQPNDKPRYLCLDCRTHGIYTLTDFCADCISKEKDISTAQLLQSQRIIHTKEHCLLRIPWKVNEDNSIY